MGALIEETGFVRPFEKSLDSRMLKMSTMLCASGCDVYTGMTGVTGEVTGRRDSF